MLLCIDLLRDPERALDNINMLDVASREGGYSVGHVLLRLVVRLLLLFLPAYFGLLVHPYLISFSRNIRYYVIILGVDGLMLFLTIYYVMSLMALKLGLRPEHQASPVPDAPNEN
jgi:hypothetical protein